MNKTCQSTFEESAPDSAPQPGDVNVVRQLLAVLVSHFETDVAGGDARHLTDTSIQGGPMPVEFMRLLQTMPRQSLVTAVCELSYSFVTALAASREQIALIGLTDFGMAPHQIEQLNLPTMLGSLMGKLLPPVDVTKVCATCAFRPGSAANQSESTVADIWHCVGNLESFMCHHKVGDASEPTQPCRGFAQAQGLLKKTLP